MTRRQSIVLIVPLALMAMVSVLLFPNPQTSVVQATTMAMNNYNGACCLDDGSCVDLVYAEDCRALDGTGIGGVTCADIECPITLPCRVTGGGVDSTGDWDGSHGKGNTQQNVYTFGGQAGAPGGAQPQPYGEWTHHQQRGPDGSFVFHAGTHSAPPGTEIDLIQCSDPGWCSPARPAPSKQIDFEGVGTFKNIKKPSAPLANVVAGVTHHWFEVHIEDLGEPGKGGKVAPPADICPPEGSSGFVADCDCPDYYWITIYEAFDPDTSGPNMTDVIYEVYGYIKGGNLQIHPGLD